MGYGRNIKRFKKRGRKMNGEVIVDLDKFNNEGIRIIHNNENNLYYVELSSGEMMPLISPIDGTTFK